MSSAGLHVDTTVHFYSYCVRILIVHETKSFLSWTAIKVRNVTCKKLRRSLKIIEIGVIDWIIPLHVGGL